MTKMQRTTPYQEVILNGSASPELLAKAKPMQSSFVVVQGSVGPFIIVSIGVFVMNLSGLPSATFFLFLAFSMLDDILASHTGSLSFKPGN